MEFNKVIESRRSIRKYTDRPVEKELVEKIIASAQMAPSWKNQQASRYKVVMSESMVSKVKAECLPEFNANNVADAPVLIVTTFVKNLVGFGREGEPRNEVGNGWGYYDLGLCNENLILAARDNGLDTLIMGIRDGEKIRDVLAIPENEQVVAVIGLGYRNCEPQMPARKELAEVVKYY